MISPNVPTVWANKFQIMSLVHLQRDDRQGRTKADTNKNFPHGCAELPSRLSFRSLPLLDQHERGLPVSPLRPYVVERVCRFHGSTTAALVSVLLQFHPVSNWFDLAESN